MKTHRAVFPIACLALLASANACAAQTNQPLTGNMLDHPQAPAAQPAATYPLDSGRGQATPYGDNTVTGRTVPAPSPASAQQVAKADPPTAATAPAPVYEEPAPKQRAFGQTTRDLLRLQASGARSGNKLPILGDEASASYKRYIDSFSHALPEFFETTVKSSDGNN